jgi:N-methylhydantoinase A/oxoprolinase/acetone carboxylase beta subunit
LQRAGLKEGERIEGPAIVEEYDCTTYVVPQWSLTADAGVLVLEKTAK